MPLRFLLEYKSLKYLWLLAKIPSTTAMTKPVSINCATSWKSILVELHKQSPQSHQLNQLKIQMILFKSLHQIQVVTQEILVAQKMVVIQKNLAIQKLQITCHLTKAK